jgi:hypothetical protein
MRALVVAVTVFALVSLYPALSDPASADHGRAIFGIGVVGAFVLGGVLFAAAIEDGFVEVTDTAVSVRFEGFFHMHIPLADIASVSPVEPRPRCRYRFGLSTDFRERISCSHGGAFVEVRLARPQTVRLWPRRIAVTRVWLAVREHEAFAAMVAARAGASERRAA